MVQKCKGKTTELKRPAKSTGGLMFAAYPPRFRPQIKLQLALAPTTVSLRLIAHVYKYCQP